MNKITYHNTKISKKNSKTESLQFLSGGGEMGELIRSFDWSKTAVGSPDTWPQSLHIAVRIMLDCPFGMYIAWGKEYIQLYNDGYRPILGATKHPQALGISTRQTFSEVWSTIGPMFDEVMQGTPVGFPDFILHLDRNGFVEECFFDFSYSPIRLEDGEVGGVLVTVIETTEKVNNFKKLAESNDQLNFAIEATELGTWEYNPITNKFTGNNRLKDWFGFSQEVEIELSLAIDLIVEKDRNRVADAIQKALQYESGGVYDIEYGIINSVTKQQRIVRAKGRAWFGEDKIAYRFNGTLQDITKETIAKNKIEESEQSLRSIILQAPVAMCIFKGENFIVDLANDRMFELWGKPAIEVMHKPIFEALPEAKGQGLEAIVQEVYSTGKTFSADGVPVTLPRNGGIELVYVNLVYEPYREPDGKVSGILAVAIDVTAQLTASKQIDASEKRLSKMVLQSPFAFAILMGRDLVITLANDTMKQIWGKGTEIVGKPLFVVLPELIKTVFPKLLDDVYITGVPHLEKEILAKLEHDGVLRDMYFNLVYQPFQDADDTIIGVTVIAIEITEQVNAKRQIEASEHRLSDERMVLYNSFMNAPAGISILKGENHIYEFVNAEYEKSVDRKITLGKTVQEHFPEIEQQGLIAILNNVFSTGEPFIANEFPVELNNKNNGKLDLHYYNSAIQPIKDEKGDIVRLLSHGVEVSQQVKARQQIEEANNQLRTAAALTENIADAVVGTDMDFKTISWNKGAENLYGYASEEVIGNYAMALLGTQFLSDEDMQAWPKALDATGKWQGEVVQSKKDGTQVSVLVSISYVYDEKGKPIAAVAVNRDITDRKKAEEKIAASETKFRTLSETIPHMIWTATPDGKKNFFNNYFLDYTGLSFEELEGDGWQKIIFPDDLGKELQQWQHTLKTGEDLRIEKRIRQHDGTYQWHLNHSIAQKDNEGNIIGWIGTSTDIHEQKIKEQQKDEFISIASHEMKTPLTTAKGYIELLLLSLSEENQTALYASKANQAVEKLHDLVTELLDASKIQNGQLNFNITTFDFNKMVDEAIENMQHSAKNHIIQKTGNCLQQITGDRSRLQQVLINLLSNAIKYSPNADKVLVKIEELNNKIQVAVQDFGIGMSGMHSDKIFDRYYRVPEHAVHFQGLGIGLYISNNIIQRHEGKMWVESEPDKGSIFFFTLPI
ncbi:MAG: PAS domain S-box protein [Chitinophagaceae bacterium]